MAEEQWKCGMCGFTNKARNEYCGGNGPLGCKMPKAMSAANAAGADEMPAAPWSCGWCGFKNKETNTKCGGKGHMGCKAPYAMAAEGIADFGPVRSAKGGKNFSSPMGKGGDTEGQWVCGLCGFTNKALNKMCGGTGRMGCKAPKGMTPSQGMEMMMMPMMAMLMGGGGGGSWGGGGGGKGKGKSNRSGPRWLCGICGFTNSMQNKMCGGTGPMGCKAERPPDATEVA
mmetsp:Transcript_59303/g.109611  ORF Transcript_59303/g.109611 Transcript_59303/m.109611 type:complete len:228 (-) Transcript_59303:176-859(-)